MIELYLIHQGRVSRYRCSLVVEFAHQAGEWLELVDARWKRLDNLGLKGRCTQCRTIFDLVEQPATPEETRPPVVVPPPPPLPPIPDPEPEFEAYTFSLRLPDPPAAPEVKEPVSKETPADDEFDWSDEIEE